MPKIKLPKTSSSRQDMSRLMYIAGVVLVVLAAWLWWHNIYTNPNTVFWKMMSNNLATQSVTKHVIEDDQGQTIDQYTQLRFGSQTATRNLVKISQTAADGKSEVVSESIGTLSNDYSRYLSIDSPEKGANGQPLDFSKVEGVWGKTADAQAGQSSQAVYFRQGALNSVVPFAWVDANTRQNVIDFMKNKQVYNVSFGKVQKKQENGHSVYVYPVDINAQAYISMLQQFVQKLGLDVGQALDPSAYQDIPPVQAEFSVDPISRQLTKIHYVASSRDEDFMSYGLSKPIEIPSSTIPVNDLQQRLQTLQ